MKQKQEETFDAVKKIVEVELTDYFGRLIDVLEVNREWEVILAKKMMILICFKCSKDFIPPKDFPAMAELMDLDRTSILYHYRNTDIKRQYPAQLDLFNIIKKKVCRRLFNKKMYIEMLMMKRDRIDVEIADLESL